MKVSQAVIDGLQEVLTAELTAINQYFMHHALTEHWGYDLLSKAIRAESIDEMRHAEALMERILFLDGMPDLQKYEKLRIGTDVPSIMKNDYDLELEAVTRLNRLITLCMEEGDHASADLLRRILSDEEHHIDWLENQTDLIKALGLQNYLLKQMSDTSEASGEGGALKL